jgi:hypothetical protein
MWVVWKDDLWAEMRVVLMGYMTVVMKAGMMVAWMVGLKAV